MNKTKSLLALCLFASANIMGNTNKTFLTTRPVGVNIAMEGTTWHTQINKPDGNDDKFGASFQIVGFYQEDSDNNLGKYFGFDNKNSLRISTSNDSNIDIDKRHLLHDHMGIRDHVSANGLGDDNPFSGTINLSVDHKAAGVRIDYKQDLDGLVDGLFFKVRTPITWEEYEMKLGLSSSVSATINNDGGASDLLSGVNSTTVDIADYFSGNITQSIGLVFSDRQAALTRAKISGVHSKTCLSDIDFLVGWNFWEEPTQHAGVNVGLTIPTGSSPDGVFVWEAQCGNNDHWAFGAGVDLKVTTFQEEKHALDVDFAVDWRYLIEADETRTLGLVGKKWGQYFLFGESGSAGVFPAANVLTRKVDVKPGHQVDSRFGLAYRYGNLTADLGYNLYARESEKVSIKEAFPSSTYGIARADYNPVNNFAAANIAPLANVSIDETFGTFSAGSSSTEFLSQSDLDTSVAESPSLITHKLYGGVGYAFNEWESPVMLGVGGSYEFASEQKALESWSLWGKLGVSF